MVDPSKQKNARILQEDQADEGAVVVLIIERAWRRTVRGDSGEVEEIDGATKRFGVGGAAEGGGGFLELAPGVLAEVDLLAAAGRGRFGGGIRFFCHDSPWNG